MKYIKKFENKEDKYVIVGEHPSGLIVNVKMKSKLDTANRFIFVDTVDDDNKMIYYNYDHIIYYTLEAAKLKIISLSEEYSNFKFREMLSDDFETLKNSKKYNL